jgi:hypothetical protein
MGAGNGVLTLLSGCALDALCHTDVVFVHCTYSMMRKDVWECQFNKGRGRLAPLTVLQMKCCPTSDFSHLSHLTHLPSFITTSLLLLNHREDRNVPNLYLQQATLQS